MLEKFLILENIENLKSADEVIEKIQAIQDLQMRHEKMYTFANENHTEESLNEMANTCISFSKENTNEFSKINHATKAIKPTKSNNIELDFI